MIYYNKIDHLIYLVVVVNPQSLLLGFINKKSHAKNLTFKNNKNIHTKCTFLWHRLHANSIKQENHFLFSVLYKIIKGKGNKSTRQYFIKNKMPTIFPSSSPIFVLHISVTLASPWVDTNVSTANQFGLIIKVSFNCDSNQVCYEFPAGPIQVENAV